MRLETVPMKRLCAAFAVLLPPLLGAPALAGSVTDSVTGAFETIVIDATNATSKATAAAKEALSDDKGKSKPRKKNASDDKTAAGDKATGKDGKADKPSKAKGDPQKDPGAGKTEADQKPAKADPGKGDPAHPAEKAADDGKAADPKSTTKDGAVKDDVAGKKPPPIPTEWPAVEVELAKARCTQLLKGVDAVTIPEAPFRKGDCGTMAPVRLVSIGKTPEISFSPPPVVTCDMVIAMTKWMKDEVQPAARKHLGSEVIRVESMSDYSCRMAYGRVGNKLSEHGKANALDIRGFITRKGQQAIVLTDWGPNHRDIEREIAAAKVAAQDAATERAEAAELAAKSGTTGTTLPRKTLVEGVPPKRDNLALPAAATREGPATPARLGGVGDGKKSGRKEKQQGKQKKPDTVAALPPPEGAGEAVPPPPKTPSGRFLHEVHASACRIFGTTLGPEANEAHRNHFHVDMAERKFKKICD